MQQRAFTFVRPAFGLAIFFAAFTPAYAADNCLAGPKGATPAGQHWYYRIDRETKKHCWYLSEQGARTNKTASAKPVAVTGTPQSEPLEESVADARAELPSTNTVPEANTSPAAPPVAVTQAAPEPDPSLSKDSAYQMTTHDLITQPPTTLASRLPLPNEFQPAEPQLDQTMQADVAARSESQKPAQNIDARIGVAQIVLCILAIVLALAAIFGRSIFQYVARTRHKPQVRRQIWPDDIKEGGTHPSSYAQMITPERRARAAQVKQDVAEIERLLSNGSQRLR